MSLRSSGFTVYIHSYTFNIFTSRNLLAFQADRINGSYYGTGGVRLDLELLKPFSLSAIATETIGRSLPPNSVWLEYTF